ncbi:MAG: pyrimidine-nucleoside phosphorylase [Erysipelothrix sp.]|nr:pyrimidine-nucleoside phosphorylase [Erysipelothrix sp.]
MRFVDIIEKKRDGHALSKEEINFWIDGIVAKTIPDYQSSALLMAITIKGMDLDETAYLTDAMVKSGEVIDLSEIKGIKVDKHSTGGVGDKTSMVIGPIVAACGGKVAKMSGRGLGHTGGTLDKLESIEGFNVSLTRDAFIKQVNDINLAIVGQTDNLVYADKVLYALRDVTGTVQSLPLIAASIMSKKLAGGAEAIVLDVKFGEGAFMKTVADAKALAETMIQIGEKLNKDVTALITSMNQPLGETVGNALEVYESVRTLQNSGPEDLNEICLVASGHMLFHGGQATSYEEGYKMAQEALKSGKAYEVFKKWILAQGGQLDFLDNLGSFIDAKYKVNVVAEEDGYIKDMKALEMGLVSSYLGAGRATVDDVIDMKAGIILNKRVGDFVKKGQLLGVLQSSNEIKDSVIDQFKACFEITKETVDKPILIEDVL